MYLSLPPALPLGIVYLVWNEQLFIYHSYR